MKVYALVGRSGTGKSYRAQNVAGMYDIEYMLDDGLFIKGTKVIAGVSAKREDTRIAAIRRAIYLDARHRAEVKKAIEQEMPDKLLIIGTSEHMIHRILEQLNLGEEYILVRIEEVSTPEDIENALKSRRTRGKHVIPVPTFEIKKDFSGYFVDSIKHLVKKSEKNFETYEKTVVRPTYSYLGSYEIKDAAIKAIAAQSAEEQEGVIKVVSVDINNQKRGIIILVGVILRLDKPLHHTGHLISERIKSNLEYMTGLNVLEVNINVKGIRLT